MVESDVELLSSTDQADIFLAGTRLMRQVQFLSSYTANAVKGLTPSAQYKAIEMDKENKFS